MFQNKSFNIYHNHLYKIHSFSFRFPQCTTALPCGLFKARQICPKPLRGDHCLLVTG